jgi:hypothetical protein
MDNVRIITLETLTKQTAQYIRPGNYLFQDEVTRGITRIFCLQWTYCNVQSRYLIRTARYPDIQEPFLGNDSINTFLLQQTLTQQWYSNRGTVFSVRSVPRCYNRDDLGQLVSCKSAQLIGGEEKTRRLVWNGCELVASVLSWKSGCEDFTCDIWSV